MNESIAKSLKQDGFAIVPACVSDATADHLCAALDVSGKPNMARRRGQVFTIRNLVDTVPEVRMLATDTAILSLAKIAEPVDCVPIKATLFDERAVANWLVPWHQDLAIAVVGSERPAEYGPWTTKAGVLTVQPPAGVLERIVAVRVHLDDCGLENGPLRVLPGSHRGGRLSSAEIERLSRSSQAVSCLVPRGGVLLMRPLLVHASSPAQNPKRRRVVHIEYSGLRSLPGGLRWRYAPACD